MQDHPLYNALFAQGLAGTVSREFVTRQTVLFLRGGRWPTEKEIEACARFLTAICTHYAPGAEIALSVLSSHFGRWFSEV